jgi:hypothetical protein
MSEESPKLQEQIIKNLPMILLAGGAVYFVNKILNKAGKTVDDIAQGLQLKKADEQVKSEQQSKEAIDRYTTEIQKKQKPTRPDGFWAQMAERIYRDTRYSATGDDHKDVQLCLSYCANDADYALLYKYYGRRQETWFGLIPDGDLKDLNQTVQSNLNQSQKKFINNIFAQKKISMRF